MAKRGPPIGPEGRTALIYLTRYPDMPSRTLARMLRRDHPKKYRNIDNARSVIRRYRGTKCNAEGKGTSVKDFVLPPPTLENPRSLPESVEISYEPYIIGPACDKALILADAHIPFHVNDVINLAFDEALDMGVNCVVLLGDIADCYRLSRWEKDPDTRRFPEERENVRHFLMVLRKTFPNAKIIYKRGNHEYRFERELINKAPEFYGMEEFRLDVLFGLSELGIDWVTDKRLIKYGHLWLLHGDEYKGTSSSVNPARGMALKAKECTMAAHNHRRSEQDSKTISGKVIGNWSIGCACDLHPKWLPLNEWQHGYALLERTDDEGNFVPTNRKVIKGKSY